MNTLSNQSLVGVLVDNTSATEGSDIAEELQPSGIEVDDGGAYGGFFDGLETSSIGEEQRTLNEEMFEAFSETLQRLYQPHQNIDTREEVLIAFCSLADRIEDCEVFAVDQVAVALTYGAQLVMSPRTSLQAFHNRAAHLLDCLERIKGGKELVSGVISLFKQAAKDETLSKLLGWQMQTRSSQRPTAIPSVTEAHASTETVVEPDANPDPQPVPSPTAITLMGDMDAARATLQSWVKDPRGKKQEVRLAVLNHPEQVLALVQVGSEELGLTSRGLADVAEMVVSELPFDQAQELVGQHLSPERIAEITSELGDRPTTIFSDVVSPEVIIVSLARSVREIVYQRDHHKGLIHDGGTEAKAFGIFLAELDHFRSHPDFQEILDVRVGEYTLKDYLLVSMLVQVPLVVLESVETDDEPEDDAPLQPSEEEPSSVEAEADEENEDHLIRQAVFSLDVDSSYDSSVRLVATPDDVQVVPRSSFLDYELNPEESRARLLELLERDTGGLTMSGFLLRVREEEADSVPQEVTKVANVAATLF